MYQLAKNAQKTFYDSLNVLIRVVMDQLSKKVFDNVERLVEAIAIGQLYDPDPKTPYERQKRRFRQLLRLE